MRYTDSKRPPTTIKIIKKAYLDDKNGMTVVETSSTATMEAKDDGGMAQNKERRKKTKNGCAVTYRRNEGGRVFKI